MFHIVMIQIKILNIVFKYANTVAVPHTQGTTVLTVTLFQSRNLSRTLYRNRSVNDMHKRYLIIRPILDLKINIQNKKDERGGSSEHEKKI